MKFSEESRVTPFFDNERNEEILEEVEVEPVDDKLRRCKSNCPRKVKE
jgi:hypothetical protein